MYQLTILSNGNEIYSEKRTFIADLIQKLTSYTVHLHAKVVDLESLLQYRLVWNPYSQIITVKLYENGAHFVIAQMNRTEKEWIVGVLPEDAVNFVERVFNELTLTKGKEQMTNQKQQEKPTSYTISLRLDSVIVNL